jgi:hypothetical protein
MPELTLLDPVELTDAELDLVTGGAAGAAGLVAVAVNVSNVANKNTIQIANNALNNNTVNVFVPIVV